MTTLGDEISTDSPGGRAAEYVQMSTEHQRYSTDNQADAIRSYAARRNYTIVRTYADEGKVDSTLTAAPG
jgi:DNA invertase Pin-like site-specific DNA recombinase